VPATAIPYLPRFLTYRRAMPFPRISVRLVFAAITT
jgi:hypothetical protein